MRKNVISTKGAYISLGVSVVGKKENDGPLGGSFDIVDPTDSFGMPTWEQSEQEMQRIALGELLRRAGRPPEEFGLLLGGDLQNQCTASAYGLLQYGIPYLGLYGACSTSAEGLLIAAMAVSGGFVSRAAAVTSSHNCTCERIHRNPIEYGGQRTPTAQWTVTGAGAFLVDGRGDVEICEVCPGIPIEMGVKDTANMGAAMAPAALSTIERYLMSSGRRMSDFDAIYTGDLGFEGGSILEELLLADGYTPDGRLKDCGKLIYDRDTQDVHSGGSGCGCSAVVLASYILPRLVSGRERDVLFIATGAMMSPDTIKQGKAIPAVAHLLRLRAEGGM